MSSFRTTLFLGTALLCACAAPGPPPIAMMPGGPPSFADFGEDENTCRHEGEAAIQAAADQPDEAAHRYDYAYQRCMFMHGRNRQMQSMSNSVQPDGPGQPANVNSFEYPDAFYSIPYATPGYGYDGFSPR